MSRASSEDAHEDRRIRGRSLAIVNGRVWARPGATAVAVDGDRIVAVGTGFEASHVVDARGAWILPAFNDAHVHFLMGSRGQTELDLSRLATLSDIGQHIGDYLMHGYDREWVVGRGWLYSAFPGGMPTVEQLDRFIPERPAYIESFDAHTGWANSRALAIAGLEIEGALTEDARLAVTRHIPGRTQAEDLDALRLGMRLARLRGIASVQEAGDGEKQLGLWRTLRDRGELTLRVRLAFDLTPDKDVERLGQAAPGDAWMATGILKAFADGVVESQTAALLEPYAGSSERGEALWDARALAAAVHEADARGWQVEVHAIGDAAIRMALDAFEGTTPGRRHRVEHVETPDPRDVGRFVRLGVVASMQPQHSDPRLTEVWRHKLGPERMARGWPWVEIARTGGRLAFGTDWPVVPLDPLKSIAIAQETLGLEAAVEAWTSGSAYAEHAEHEKGKIREGMLADLAVVDLDRATVSATVVGGRVVYES